MSQPADHRAGERLAPFGHEKNDLPFEFDALALVAMMPMACDPGAEIRAMFDLIQPRPQREESSAGGEVDQDRVQTDLRRPSRWCGPHQMQQSHQFGFRAQITETVPLTCRAQLPGENINISSTGKPTQVGIEQLTAGIDSMENRRRFPDVLLHGGQLPIRLEMLLIRRADPVAEVRMDCRDPYAPECRPRKKPAYPEWEPAEVHRSPPGEAFGGSTSSTKAEERLPFQSIVRDETSRDAPLPAKRSRRLIQSA